MRNCNCSRKFKQTNNKLSIYGNCITLPSNGYRKKFNKTLRTEHSCLLNCSRT